MARNANSYLTHLRSGHSYSCRNASVQRELPLSLSRVQLSCPKPDSPADRWARWVRTRGRLRAPFAHFSPRRCIFGIGLPPHVGCSLHLHNPHALMCPLHPDDIAINIGSSHRQIGGYRNFHLSMQWSKKTQRKYFVINYDHILCFLFVKIFKFTKNNVEICIQDIVEIVYFLWMMRKSFEIFCGEDLNVVFLPRNFRIETFWHEEEIQDNEFHL